MAATSGVGSTTDTPPVKFSEKKGYQSLTTEDFVQLLVTQLQNQNPLDPMKDSDLTQQVSSIQSLNSTSQLVSTLDAFGQNQSLGAASGLIGREISGKVDNKAVSGVADKAIVEDGKVYVMVGDSKVPFDSITSVGPTDSSSDSTLSTLLSSLTNKTDTSSDSTSNATADQMAALLSAMQAQSQSDATSSDSSVGSDTASQQDMIDALQSMASSGGSA